MDILEEAREIIDIETSALHKLHDMLDEGFVDAVNLIHECKGNLIITGVGKSGIIAKKIAATMSSTGTRCFFLHPAEGLHGDLGIVGKDDVVFTISKSGKSEEILGIIPSLHTMGVKIISMLGDVHSPIAKKSDIVINASVEKEACPHNLAPTASTTVALVLGDAISVVLLKMKNFTPDDFALLHPGGSLGKRLTLLVRDIMHSGDENPVLSETTSMENVLIEMTGKALGSVSLVDGDGKLSGIITDGDLRRGLQHFPDLLLRKASEIMTVDPIVSHEGTKACKALSKMEERKSQIAVLPVVNDRHEPIGTIRIHDLIKAGL